MSIGGRITLPATLHVWTKSPNKDAAGDEQFTHVDHPVSIFVEIQQSNAAEHTENRTVQLTWWTVFVRLTDANGATITLDPKDEITADGKRYAFDAEPWVVRNPRTRRNSHWYGRLRKVA